METVVGALVSSVFDSLNTILQREVSRLVGVRSDIQNLSRTFDTIRAVLEDAEARGKQEQTVRIWLKDLKDVAYEVDDILDDWNTQDLKSQAEGSSFSMKKVWNSLSSPIGFNRVVLHYRIGRRIKKARRTLTEIADRRRDLRLSEKERPVGEDRKHETGSQVYETQVVGRERDKEIVLDWLLRSKTEVNGVPVISIIGMPGLGKTTIAQLVFNDQEVKRHFDLHFWVCVSVNFDMKKIAKSIIRSRSVDRSAPLDLYQLQHLGLHDLEYLELDLLQHCIQELVREKRVLLVLDDVWDNDNSEEWDRLRLLFRFVKVGSWIIITTRDRNVALKVGTTYTHKLGFLSDDDCWSLFEQRSLEHRGEEERSQLEDIGREIAVKCGGVPLTANTIGSAMRSKLTRREWEEVKESETWHSLDALQNIMQALLLSYYNLPSNLKQCFIYCSIFPKGYQIEKDMLVQLWMAQGFIRSDGSTDVEEVGGRHFSFLLGRSLLQDGEADGDGNILKYTIHSLILELAQRVAGSECLTVKIGNAEPDLTESRHAFIWSDVEGNHQAELPPNLSKAHRLRSLAICLDIRTIPPNFFDHLTCLRALYLRGDKIQKLPHKIGKLRHLRYLDLCGTSIDEVPKTVTNLYNLQTLKLSGCSQIHKLPKGMRQMVSLRHLDLSGTKIEKVPEAVSSLRNLQTLKLNGCSNLSKLPKGMMKMVGLRHLEIKETLELCYLPRGIGGLSSLQTLSKFIVDGEKGCDIRELERLDLLQGELLITGLENVTSAPDAKQAKLDKKQHLHALRFEYKFKLEDEWNRMEETELRRMDEIIEALQPNAKLKELGMWYYPGSTFPSWIGNPLFFNLVTVELNNCRKCRQLPCLGRLPSLKYLKFWGLAGVTTVGDEFYGESDGSCNNGVSFPKLEKLTFTNMPHWEEWEVKSECAKLVTMPSLRQLSLDSCPKLKALPENLPTVLDKLSLRGDNARLLSEVSLPNLPKLNNLEIVENGQLRSFPSGWLGQFKVLNALFIIDCPALESLPEDLTILPMLQTLVIGGCRLLQERCQDGGADQHKIARIPNIQVVS